MHHLWPHAKTHPLVEERYEQGGVVKWVAIRAVLSFGPSKWPWAAASNSNVSAVPAVTSVKHPAKIQIWSIFSCYAMFQVCIVSQKTAISDE